LAIGDTMIVYYGEECNLMVGYAASHDKSGNWKNIDITVLDVDEFAMEAYGCSKFSYLYNRDSECFTPRSCDPSENLCNPKLLKNIVSRLTAEELKNASAISVMWRSFPDFGVELLKTELSEKVWLPMPIVRDGTDSDSVDITKLLFDALSPKPFEISIAVYVLNYLVWMSGIRISTAFFDCRTRVFMNSGFLKPLFKIFRDTPKFKADYLNRYVRQSIFKPRIDVNVKSIIRNLEANSPVDARYDGGTQCFAVGIKNDCLKRCADLLINCIRNKMKIEDFLNGFKEIVKRAVSEFRVLSELFVAGENLYRSSDIMYLDINKFIEACSFGESLLNLKKTVREYTDNYRVLNNQKIPDIIKSNGEYVFLKG